jgi:hypothetical protein
MYSPIEKRRAPYAVQPPPGDGRAAPGAIRIENRLPPPKTRTTMRWALAMLAAVAATSCSNANGIVVATIREDAGIRDAGDATVCTTEDHKVKDMGVDLYIMFDHSEQWDSPPPVSPIVTWLTEFFADANFAGIGVGLTTYPMLGPPDDQDQDCFDRECPGPSPSCWCILRSPCGCTLGSVPDRLGSCQCVQVGTTCEDPFYRPDVGIVRLGEGGRELQSAIYDTISRPFMGEPALRPVIQGALNYRATWEALPQNEGRRITQVLVATASSQAECDWRNVESERLLAGPGKPKTYIVAVNAGMDADELDVLAAAGGTERAVAVTIRSRSPSSPPVVMPATNPFVDIAEKVRTLEGRCEYLLPESVTDIAKVNLLAPGGGAPIPRVENRPACQRAGTGWFWDPNQPRRIFACESTCKNTLRVPQTGTATIQYGCPTVAADAGL